MIVVGLTFIGTHVILWKTCVHGGETMKGIKKGIALILTLFMLMPLLSGCEDGPVTLTVLIDGTTREDMRRQIRKMISEYEEAHSDVTLELQILPTDEAEREVKLEQVQTQIMAGKGPDIYLMPTRCFYREALFNDVGQAMRNGVFMDISKLYDVDTELDKDGLLSQVMDAGVLDDARYTLPLRYDFPVVCVDVEQFETAGLNTGIFDGGITELLDAVLATERQDIAASADLDMIVSENLLNFFPELMDYEEQEVLVAQDEVAGFLRRYQLLVALIGERESYRRYPDISSYISDGESFWANQGFCMNIGSLDDAVQNAAIARIEGIDLAMLPVTSTDGSLVADVTFFGAVGRKCKNPEIAYNFLRQFLTEQTQWEDNRPQRKDTSIVGDERLIETGWPVRSAGATVKLYSSLWSQVSGVRFASEEAVTKLPQFRELELIDEDIPVLQAKISSVRYPISTEYELSTSLLDTLNDSNNGYAPTNVDIDAVAAQFIEKLGWHLMEG